MTEPEHDEDDLATLQAIAEGQGVSYEGLSKQELIDRLRDAGVLRAGDDHPSGATVEDEGTGPTQGRYGQEGVGRRESVGEPAADTSDPES